MRLPRKTLIMILPVMALVALSTITTLKSQSNIREAKQKGIEASEFDSQFPLTDYDEVEPGDPKKKVDRKIKAKKYNKADTAVDPHLVKVVEHYHWPADFPALPVNQSEIVIVGSVSGAEAHLSDDKTGIFSEFTIRVEEILKIDATKPLALNNIITLEREGGRVRFPRGHIGHLYVAGLGMPRAGKRYVFFLKRNTLVEDSYFILTGYELRASRVYPLDTSGVVRFDQYADTDEEVFLNNLRALVNSSTQSSPK